MSMTRSLSRTAAVAADLAWISRCDLNRVS
jgi:hypothetical protein